MLERDIEKKVVDHAKKTGWLSYKFVSPGKRGVPDRIFFYDGFTCVIEFKSAGGRATALQLKELERLNNAGIPGLVTSDVDTGCDWLDQLRWHWVFDKKSGEAT